MTEIDITAPLVSFHYRKVYFMDEERWGPIPGFSKYNISTHGNVYNMKRGSHVRTSYTNHGHPKVSLIDDEGERHTLSISLLMARTFLEAPPPRFDSVIVLDGDLERLRASELAWRPTWFAWKYVRQLNTQQPIYYHNLQVVNVDTRDLYPSIVVAGMTEGLLFEDIWMSTHTGMSVFPHGYSYEIQK